MTILQRILQSCLTALLGVWFLVCFSTSVSAQTLSRFGFDNFHTGSAKIAGVPFPITITAYDASGNMLTSFTNQVTLHDETGSLYPTQTTNFVNGQWTGFVYVTKSLTTNRITATFNAVSNASETFAVNADTRIRFLSIASGNNQSSTVGNQLSQALTVRVVDPYGNPLPNIGVNFATTSVPPNATHYSLTSTSGTSNASGQVSTIFTLGRKSGTYIVNSSLSSGITNAVQFYLTATPSNLISIAITPQVAVLPAGSYIPFKAVGYDQYLNDIVLPSVTWSIQNGGGTIDNTGVFYAGDTLGMFSNTVKATSGAIGATASVNIVDVWGGTSGAGGSGSGSGGSGGSGGTASPTPEPSPTPTPTPTPPPTPTPSPSPAPGVLYNVQIEPEVISVLKNARIPIIAEGVDYFGNPVSGVNFSFEVSSELGTITQTGPNTALLVASDNGIGTVTVSALQGTVAKYAKVVGSVGTGLNRRLVIEDIQSPQRVGEPFTISIAAKDSLNNFITDYTGPLVLADTTGTIDPATVQPSESGIWYVQAIISAAHDEVTVTAAGDGMVGVSNIFSVEGDPKKDELGLGAGGKGSGMGGLGDVLGASISGKIDEILNAKNLNKYAVVRYIGAGIATGLGIMGASVGGGLMASRGLEAIGRNPFAKTRLQANLYVSLVAFIAVASLAVFAAMIIVR